ncbi:MAG: hypothetical protein R3D86_04380 [Emcibacteraceae bacterium]
MPLNIDIQPFAGIFALSYLVANIKTLEINRNAIFLFCFSIFAITWALFIKEENKIVFKILAFPYALIIYVFIYNTLNKEIILSVKKYAIVYISFSLFQFIFPAFYSQFSGILVRDVKIKDISGVRGISALTTEPSFTAFVLFTFLVIICYSNVFVRTKAIHILNFFIGICIALTKASTGIIMIATLFLYEGIKRLNIYRIIIVGTVFIAFYFSINYFDLDKYRAVNLMTIIASSPEKILYQGSLFVRIYSITAGFVSLANNPFGVALGNVDLNSLKMITDSIFYGYTFDINFELVAPDINMPSTLGMGLLIFGYFYLIFYILLFFPLYVNKNVPALVKFLVFAFTAQSFSFAFPLLWFLIVMAEKGFWESD